ncbi:MAG: caspase family protein [Aridibacter famidurans]|nr:caspase family protein [Aridibacter famidurans]
MNRRGIFRTIEGKRKQLKDIRFTRAAGAFCLAALVLLSSADTSSQLTAGPDAVIDTARLVVQTGHSGSINDIAISPDGRLIASAGDEGIVIIWEAESRRMLSVLKGHSGAVKKVAFSNDGMFLAAGTGSREDDEPGVQDERERAGFEIRVWTVPGWDEAAVFRGHKGEITGLQYTSDSQPLLISASADGSVRRWIGGGEVLFQAKDVGPPGEEWVDPITAVAVSPDSKQIAFKVGSENDIRLVSSRDGSPIGKLSADYEENGHNLAFTKDSRFLIATSQNPFFAMSTVSYEGVAEIWDLKNDDAAGKPVAKFGGGDPRDIDAVGLYGPIAVSPGSASALVPCKTTGGLCRLWLTAAGTWNMEEFANPCFNEITLFNSIELSSDGKYFGWAEGIASTGGSAGGGFGEDALGIARFEDLAARSGDDLCSVSQFPAFAETNVTDDISVLAAGEKIKSGSTIWDLQSSVATRFGQTVDEFSEDSPYNRNPANCLIRFSRSGKRAVFSKCAAEPDDESLSAGRELSVIDIDSGRVIYDVPLKYSDDYQAEWWDTRFVRFAQDDRLLVVASKHRISVFDIDNKQLEWTAEVRSNYGRYFVGGHEYAYPFALDRTGSFLVFNECPPPRVDGLVPCSMKRVDLSTFEVRKITELGCSDEFLAVVPNGKSVLAAECYGGQDGLFLVDIESGRRSGLPLSDDPGDLFGFTRLEFSPDGKFLLAGVKFVQRVETGSEPDAGAVDGQDPGEGSTESRDDYPVLKLFDTGSWKEVKAFPGQSPDIFAFSGDSRYIGFSDRLRNVVSLRNIGGSEDIVKIAVDEGIISRIAVSETGDYLFIRLEDGSTKVVETKGGKEVCRLFSLRDGNWAVTTPTGHFDASPGGREMLHYVVGVETVTLDQMKDRYYRPGLLRSIFAGEFKGTETLFTSKDLYPDVTFTPSLEGKRQIEITLRNRGGGIGPVQVLVNGKEVVADARPDGFDPDTREASLAVSLEGAAFLPGADNRIEVVARNSEGWLTNRGTPKGSKSVEVKGSPNLEPPNVYAIVAGVSDYDGNEIDLRYAAKDAEAFAAAIELGALGITEDPSKVHIRLLTAGGEGTQFKIPDAKTYGASKEDFKRAFDDFKAAEPEDVFVVFLSGHGISVSNGPDSRDSSYDNYLFLTEDADSNNKSFFAARLERERKALSGEEIKELMKQNRALKQIMILDTCAAGAVGNSYLSRDMPSDQIRALEALKDSMGFLVLAGSSADRVSYEASSYGGLLTYSLLYGIKQEFALEDGNAYVGDLFDYAKKKVPELAKEIGIVQNPRVFGEVEGRIPMLRFSEEDRRAIKLLVKKPVIVRPVLINRELDYDDRDLGTMLANALKDLKLSGSEGGAESPVDYFEGVGGLDAIRPSGSYHVADGKLVVRIRLIRNNRPLGEATTLEGDAGKPGELISRLVDMIVTRATEAIRN